MCWRVRECHVFFQGGDGIRGHCVTGVQTCALPISESAILAGIKRLMRGRTVLVITHRSSMLDGCAALVAIENGRVVAEIGRASCRERVEIRRVAGAVYITGTGDVEAGYGRSPDAGA